MSKPNIKMRMATKKKVSVEWKSTGGLAMNETLSGKGFYVSYAPGYGLSMIGLFASDNRSDETALCKDGKYYILNGDFRKEYAAVFSKGFSACMKVYGKHKRKHDSSWTSKESPNKARGIPA